MHGCVPHFVKHPHFIAVISFLTMTQLYFTLRSVTGPPQLYKYRFDIEMETIDADQLKMELSELDLPLPLATSEQVEITDINVTTGENSIRMKMHCAMQSVMLPINTRQFHPHSEFRKC